MTFISLALAVSSIFVASAAAQGLPVKSYSKNTAFQGNPRVVILDREGAQYALVSAHKEAGRPWADALFYRYRDDTRTLMNRAYDCAAGTYRWLGEGKDFPSMSAAVKPSQTGDRQLQPGSVEYALARYVCGL
ncbi:hypothetical protein [Halovulum sp. GXIMD14793]